MSKHALVCVAITFDIIQGATSVGWMEQYNRTAINVVIDVGYNGGSCASKKVGDMSIHIAG